MTTVVLQIRPCAGGHLVVAMKDSGLVLADWWHAQEAEAMRKARMGVAERFVGDEVAFRVERVSEGEERL